MPLEVKVKIEGDQRTLVQLGSDTEKMLELLIRDIAELTLNKADQNLDLMNINYKGMLKRSGFIDKPGKLTRHVIYETAYADTIEFGRSPGGKFPPVKALEEWARVKLGLEPEEAKKASWAIARNLHANGTLPRPFFRNAIEAILANGLLLDQLIQKHFP